MNIYNIISLFGIFILVAVAWIFSPHKKNINWKVIIWGITIQIIIALFIFIVPSGTRLFLFLNDVAIKILDSASMGARFIFGRLALPPGQVNEQGETSLGFILAFQAFPTIIFFSALISILYFLNIMPLIIRTFAYIFTKLMRVSGAESLVCASNVFIGVESALTVKPYLDRMTSSEFCTVLTSGMATIASNVLALYTFCLREQFPTIAGHLISASLLSAPAALVMAKTILPETEKPQTLGIHVKPYYKKENNLFEAIINGANTGVKMIVGIVSLLIAILGLIALLNLILDFFNLSLKDILGYVFYPFTLVLGIPIKDVSLISKIIGERAIVTEVVSYNDLARAIANNLISNPRSVVIATYALCGFAHLASMAIFVGGTAALAPHRTNDIARVSIRALIAATLACLQTACVAGVFFRNGTILLGSNLSP